MLVRISGDWAGNRGPYNSTQDPDPHDRIVLARLFTRTQDSIRETHPPVPRIRTVEQAYIT
jgi:hypothetical protein